MTIYNNSKYANTYFNIINRASSENRKRTDNNIYEKHHIIPKSCNGIDDNENLVFLTPKEHYICHRLLPKMVKTKIHYEKMIFALWCMINGNGKSERYSPSGKVYQQIKEEQTKIRSSKMSGPLNHFYGKTHTEEFKKWFSENNPSKSLEIAEKISKAAKKRFENKENHPSFGKELSNETKEKIRQVNLGKTHTEETKQKMSESGKNKIWIRKDGVARHIPKDKFEEYYKLGWERGRILGKQKSTRFPLTNEQKEALSEKLSKRIWIKKEGVKSKHIDIDDFEKWYNEGWERGRGGAAKRKKEF